MKPSRAFLPSGLCLPNSGIKVRGADLKEIETLAGNYAGSGAWVDTTGNSDYYSVRHAITSEAAAAEVAFVHEFNDGTSIEAQLRFEHSTGPIFDVHSEDGLVGHGYFEEGSLHYHMRAGEAYIEVSYRVVGDDLRIYGSSTRNAEGNYIVWLERLHRVTQDASASPQKADSTPSRDERGGPSSGRK